MTEMNKKLIVIAVALILIVSVSLVYAQQSGYFINIFNSNANLNTYVANSTVIENVTLSNSTLDLHINADNISSVIINGVNYTAQATPTASPSNSPGIIISYYGLNVGPQAILSLTGMISSGDITDQNYTKVICYTWNITMVNLNANQAPGGPILDQALEPLVTEFPQMISWKPPIEVMEGNSSEITYTQTLLACCGAFGGNDDKCCLGLYASSPLSSDQIKLLTKDLIAQLTPALIDYYS